LRKVPVRQTKNDSTSQTNGKRGNGWKEDLSSATEGRTRDTEERTENARLFSELPWDVLGAGVEREAREGEREKCGPNEQRNGQTRIRNANLSRG